MSDPIFHVIDLTSLSPIRLRRECEADSDAAGMPTVPGAYLLLLRLAGPVDFNSARLAPRFPPGWYAYAGRAWGPGGIRARVRRHARRHKQRHWHIDELTEAADELDVLPLPGGNECDFVAALAPLPGIRFPLRRFGSSDCRVCPPI